jgi:hypothetical protein
MTHTIWKFGLPIKDSAQLTMPQGSRVLTVATQGGQPYLWAVVDPRLATENRTFYVRGTGHPLGTAEGATFIGTFMLEDGLFVGHVFEGPR